VGLMQNAANDSLEQCGDVVFHNLINQSKVECRRRTRLTQTFGVFF
jgi:hypothetical protein